MLVVSTVVKRADEMADLTVDVWDEQKDASLAAYLETRSDKKQVEVLAAWMEYLRVD